MSKPKRKNVSAQKLSRDRKKRARAMDKLIRKGRLTVQQLREQSRANPKVTKKKPRQKNSNLRDA